MRRRALFTASALAIVLVATLPACRREQRRFSEPAYMNGGAAGTRIDRPSTLGVKAGGPGPYEGNAWAMKEGYRLYNQMNCVGCHANGGGGMGPPLMDGGWIYAARAAISSRPSVFPLFGAFYHWLPKITGRILGERLGKVSCALVFVGFNVAFFPQHWLGLHGMPRRVYTYLPETGWGDLNLVSTIGASILGVGFLLTGINFVRALVRGRLAGPDPWGGDSLEWALPSPPPESTRRDVFVVSSRYPLWIGQLGKVVGLKGEEILVTRTVDAEPDHKTHIPGPTLAPLFVAVSTGAMLVTCIFTPWGFPIGMAVVGLGLLAWMWPHGGDPEKLHESEEQP